MKIAVFTVHTDIEMFQTCGCIKEDQKFYVQPPLLSSSQCMLLTLIVNMQSDN